MHTYCEASVRAGRKSSKWQATRERWITHGPIGSLCPFENAKVAVKVETMGDKEPTREVRVPKDAVYAAVFVSLAAVAASAFVWSSVVACRLLAVLVLGHALCRVFLPDGAVPRVRRRRADAIMGVLLALGLWYLSAWGATPSVTLGANL